MSEQSLARLPAIGSEVRIYTQLKVSENNLALYGFATRKERSLFEALISVPGIGPKVALALLSKAKVEDLTACIIQGDAERLAKLPGLGNKTAQKLILQLGDKLAKQLLLAGTAAGETVPDLLPRATARVRGFTGALVAMGYEERRSREALDQLSAEWHSDKPDEGERLRQAIVRLSQV